MKKALIILLALALALPFAGCQETEKNLVFTGVVEDIYNSSILVSVSVNDQVDFDSARVDFAEDLELDFEFALGQSLEIEILPQIRESYPVQVTAVRISLVE